MAEAFVKNAELILATVRLENLVALDTILAAGRLKPLRQHRENHYEQQEFD